MLPKNIRSLWVETAPDKVIARARKSLEKGRYDAAASALKDALDAAGEEPRIRTELSQILLRSGQTREAAEGLKVFLKARPDEHRTVVEILEWARAQQIEAQPLHEILAEHYVSRRDFGAAFESLERVGKPGLQGLLESRLAHLNRFLEKSPQTVPRSALPLLYFAALVHEALSEYPKAVEAYRRIVGASPSEIGSVEDRLKGILARQYRSVPLRMALAEIYLGAGEVAKAVEEYARVAELEPQSASEAASALERIAQESSDPAPALWALIRVRRREGRVEDLLRTAGRLITAGTRMEDLLALLEGLAVEGKSDPRIPLLIGETALRVGKVSRATAAFASAAGHPSPEIRARGREALERLAEEHPEETKVCEALADHAIREGKPDDAVPWLVRLAGGSDSAPFAASRLQTILLSNPGHAAAESLLERIAPSLQDHRLAAAFVRRQLRRGPDQARAAVPAAAGLLEREPSDPEIRLTAAEAAFATGDVEGAWGSIRPLFDGTMGPDPGLLHLMVLIGSSSAKQCAEVTDAFRTTAPALAASPEGLFALAEMAARSGSPKEAIDMFRAAAAFSPSAAAEVLDAARSLCGDALSGEAAVALAEVLLDAGDYAGIAGIFATAGDLPPSSAGMLGRLEQAMRARPEDVDLRIAFAAALAASGKPAHGRRVVEEGIRRAGESAPPGLHLALGDGWLREGNLTEAVRAYTDAMARDKSLASEAARRLEKVLATDVGHAGAHLAQGRARLLEGRPREGVNGLLTAWSIRPALGSAVLKDLEYASRAFPLEPQVDLARAQVLLGQGEVEAASEALGAALSTSSAIAAEVLVRLEAITRSHPSCAPARLHAARAWHRRRRFAEASAAYAAAAELDPGLCDPALSGLAELVQDFPASPDPHLARARIYEVQGSLVPAADACAAAAVLGAEPAAVLEFLRRLAGREGESRGSILFALARAAACTGLVDESAAAFEEAAALSPDLLDRVRAEVEILAGAHPASASALLSRTRLALAALDGEAALAGAEALLGRGGGAHEEVDRLAAAIAEHGGDVWRCALLRARALVQGGRFDAAASLLETWIPRCEGERRAQLCLLLARIERRRGRAGAARGWLREAEGLAADRESFLAALHTEAVESARAATRRPGQASEMWRALNAALDLGDAGRAEAIAGDLGLTASGQAAPRDSGALEALARIACLRGRYHEAATLLEPAPPSGLKAHALMRSGRLVEAVACLADQDPGSGAPPVAAREIYLRLAAGAFQGEPGTLSAETHLDFSAGEPAGTKET